MILETLRPTVSNILSVGGGAGTVGFVAWALWNEFVLKIKGSG